MSNSTMEDIAQRLSSLDSLYFPRKQQQKAVDPSQRKSILFDLLINDAPVFLERYGTHLTQQELQQFETLKDDYEVNWHLNHLRSYLSPTSEEVRSRSVTVKNRRRAYLNKLVLEGSYFSEEAMREREPYLHHEFVGKFQDPSVRGTVRPGEMWSETLMRWSEEAILVEKIRGEQQRLGVDEKDWVGSAPRVEMKEEEEEEEEEEEGENKREELHSELEVEDGVYTEDQGCLGITRIRCVCTIHEGKWILRFDEERDDMWRNITASDYGREE
ncbi:hypothetical protein GIB67_015329 [Kingdonia uniflora]|uniref:CCD97-like C-terminal domain-containing protein n=1 Tax=Kingdonia uniflora TaxID=39325 RepID=A0A7J7KYN0_9MAGN|nr:hypothetical protein GIB67_015329 [Kingdonia uniflora]